MSEHPTRLQAARLSAAETAAFTAATALAAIFADAAIGHGLTWENDPYWTYWVTKTFLIATVFGLGTAWFGIGLGRGAVITAVHTLILTVYYWSLSPVGLPSHPTWLDLEHTWLTGIPIHFGVIYLGYLVVLWAWQRRSAGLVPVTMSAALGTRALVFGAGIVVVAGVLAWLALGEFPGLTWFVVRLLLTVSFLIVWWGVLGEDLQANVVGAIFLAFAWAAYAQFVGPVGLPDTPLRILDPAPPPATVRWLDYRELWLISLPIYLVVSLAAMIAASRIRTKRHIARSVAPAALVPIILFTTALTLDPADRGVDAIFRADGAVEISGGEGSGQITAHTVDMGNRVTPLPPHDEILVEAALEIGTDRWELFANQPVVEDPFGEETTWWGVAYSVDYTEGHVSFRADLVAYGLGELRLNGQPLVEGLLPVEVVAARDGDYGFEVAIGDETRPIPGVEGGVLEARWSAFIGEAPAGPHLAHYVGGGVVLSALLGLMLIASGQVRHDGTPGILSKSS